MASVASSLLSSNIFGFKMHSKDPQLMQNDDVVHRQRSWFTANDHMPYRLFVSQTPRTSRCTERSYTRYEDQAERRRGDDIFFMVSSSSSEERMYDVRKKLDGDKKAKAEKVVEGELAPCNTT